MGAKDFNVDDMGQYDLDQKTVYVAENGLPGSNPDLPRAANEEIDVHAEARIDDGVVSAGFMMTRTVYSEDIASVGEEIPDGVEESIAADYSVWVELGERVEFEGYTIRLVAVHISKRSSENYAAFVLEGIPDNVTVFPSGDPDRW